MNMSTCKITYFICELKMLCEFKPVIFVVNAQQCLQQLPQALVSFSLPHMISPQIYFLSGLLLKSETVWNTFCRIIKPLWQAISQAIEQFQTLLSLSRFLEDHQLLGWKLPLPALGPLEYFRLIGITGDFLTTWLRKGILPRNSFWNQTTQTFPTSIGLFNSNWMSQDCQEYIQIPRIQIS